MLSSPCSSSLRLSCYMFPMTVAVLLLLFGGALSTSTPASDAPDKICSRFEMTSNVKGFPYIEQLRIIGFVGGRVFSYGPTEPHEYTDKLPVNLAKLVFEDAKHLQLTKDILRIDDVDDFAPVVQLLQKRNNTMVVLSLGVRSVSLNDTHLKLGSTESTEIFYTDVERTIASMQFIMVLEKNRRDIDGDTMAPDEVHAFVYNENLFINNQFVKEDIDRFTLENTSHPCPDIMDPIVEVDLYKRPLCHKRKVPNSDEVAVASYRGILSTTKRCSPEFTLNHSTNVFIPGLNVTLANADLDCHYLRWPDHHTCLYAFGPADLFQGVQLAPSMPVTTPLPPLPYTHLPDSEPGCIITDEEVASNFNIFEWFGDCLWKLDSLPYREYVDDFARSHSVGEFARRTCFSSRSRYTVRRAVFARSPFVDDYLVMVTEFARHRHKENKTEDHIGAAYFRIPSVDNPTNVSWISYKPLGVYDTYQIRDVAGADLAVSDDLVFVMKHGLVRVQLRLFEWNIAGEDTCRIQNYPVPVKHYNYSDPQIEAIRNARKRYAYLDFDPEKRPYSVIGSWAVRYDAAYDRLQVIKTPYCSPFSFPLYGRNVFLAPLMPTTTTPAPRPPDMLEILKQKNLRDEATRRHYKQIAEEYEKQQAEVRPHVMIAITVTFCAVLFVPWCLWARRQRRRMLEGYVNDEREAAEDCECIRLFDF